MQEWLIYVSTQHYYWVYALVIILACAEGPFLSILFGVLIKLDYFSFIPVYAALMAGDLLGDVIWYYIGYHFGHRFIARFGKYFSITEEGIEKVKRIFHKYKYSILFVSKISNGFGFALVTLTTAGMVQIPFSRYMATNLAGQFIWSGFLLAVGYFFSSVYLQVSSTLAHLSIIAAFAILFFAFLGYRNYLRTRVESM